MPWNDIERRGPRMMGETERWHTWPTIQRQTTAEHQWQVLRIHHEVFGLDSVDTVLCIMHHDSPEGWTGDIPFHAKRGVPGLRDALAVGEANFCRAQHIPDVNEMGGTAAVRLKVADLLEMFEFSMREAQLGNVHGQHVMNTVWSAIEGGLLSKLPWTEQTDIINWVGARLTEHDLAMSVARHPTLQNIATSTKEDHNGRK